MKRLRSLFGRLSGADIWHTIWAAAGILAYITITALGVVGLIMM